MRPCLLASAIALTSLFALPAVAASKPQTLTFTPLGTYQSALAGLTATACSSGSSTSSNSTRWLQVARMPR